MRGPAEETVAHVEGRELPSEDVVVTRPRYARGGARAIFFVGGVALFVIALGLMREGANGLIPSLRESFLTDNPLSTLGLGWLGSCLVLSGSPVAASALALLDGEAIDRTQAFTMVTGSRLGAAFVVLVVGVLYAVRKTSHGGRRAPISIGILSLLMTAVTYLPAAVAGYALLDWGAFDALNVGTSPALTSLTGWLFGWVADALTAVAPDWTLFPLGVLVLLAGFKMFDKVLPTVGTDQLEHHSGAWYAEKWPMFALGSAVTLLTLSVSVSLALLVPLVASGRLRRANTLPYIAGANITTLADTLVAAILLGNQDAVRVVVAVTVVVTAWTLVLVGPAYPLLRRGCLDVATHALHSPRRLGLVASVLFLVPVGLIAV